MELKNFAELDFWEKAFLVSLEMNGDITGAGARADKAVEQRRLRVLGPLASAESMTPSYATD